MLTKLCSLQGRRKSVRSWTAHPNIEHQGTAAAKDDVSALSNRSAAQASAYVSGKEKEVDESIGAAYFDVRRNHRELDMVDDEASSSCNLLMQHTSSVAASFSCNS
ncbi:hypothetical protein E2562_030588 [Oryza meyeriana var. granulata]|uniref:Uncharacterized protein n=1 Tax=Oryza meyeriana var. granulata TaxID=110450 RepID=A0A6G1ER93_9ORYZ|nr:hypothetical protein E2562_030588 [Oryza meyeriana var. granulata]